MLIRTSLRLRMKGGVLNGGTSIFRSPLGGGRVHVGPMFERYAEIENATEKRIASLKATPYYNDEWIATEKVHGANFAIYSWISEKGEEIVSFSKRNGFIPKSEDFFGYGVIVPELKRFAKDGRSIVSSLVGRQLETVILYGELFGGKYDHPTLLEKRKMNEGRKKATAAVQTNQFPQYSPTIHFLAFDIKYKICDNEQAHSLTFDEATSVFEKIPGLLYAQPIIRGPMSKIVAFNVENFETSVPPLVGMGNFPLRKNWAEGIVVKHCRRGMKGFNPPCPTILKIKCKAFQESSSDPRDGPRVDELESLRADAVARTGVQLPETRSVVQNPVLFGALLELLNNVCCNRLESVLSKVGQDALVTSDSRVAKELAADALRDFLKEADPCVVNSEISTRREFARYTLAKSQQLVHSELMKRSDVLRHEHVQATVS